MPKTKICRDWKSSCVIFFLFYSCSQLWAYTVLEKGQEGSQGACGWSLVLLPPQKSSGQPSHYLPTQPPQHWAHSAGLLDLAIHEQQQSKERGFNSKICWKTILWEWDPTLLHSACPLLPHGVLVVFILIIPIHSKSCSFCGISKVGLRQGASRLSLCTILRARASDLRLSFYSCSFSCPFWLRTDKLIFTEWYWMSLFLLTV